MPTAARKTAPRKRPSAATAARREVRKEPDFKPVKIVVNFRGEKFEFEFDKLAQEKIFWRQQKLSHFRDDRSIVQLLFEILGPVDSDRFINTMRVGDEIFTAAAEFFDAFNKAANDPNS